MPGKRTAEIALELGRSMTEMRNYLRQFIEGKIRENGIDISFEMLEIMACLWKKDGVNQQDIATVTVRDKSSVTHLIDNLVKRFLVKRVAYEGDRRNKLIFLTAGGRQLQKKLHPWVLDMYNRAAGDIKAGEMEDCLHLVRKINENLKMQQT